MPGPLVPLASSTSLIPGTIISWLLPNSFCRPLGMIVTEFVGAVTVCHADGRRNQGTGAAATRWYGRGRGCKRKEGPKCRSYGDMLHFSPPFVFHPGPRQYDHVVVAPVPQFLLPSAWQTVTSPTNVVSVRRSAVD